MGAQGAREEAEEEGVARALLSPVRSFIRGSLVAAEEDFVEILHFIENAVEGALRGDPRLADYIREAGVEARLRAYRFLASLVRARRGADDILDALARDIAEALRAKR
jgi:hypothetical protein